MARKHKQNFFPSIYPEDHPRMASQAQAENHVKTPPALKAQTDNQKAYLKKLRQSRHDILFAVGPAGTGKTYLAVRDAIDKYQKGDCTKIVITRPNVATGDDLGYLPGTLTEKMAPWIRPIMDVFMECFSKIEVERMMHNEIIEIAPLAYMRGRTFKNAIVIADEMQNATPEQMKMLLTRIGENSRMIVTGDTEQYDRKELGTESGLADITRRLADRDNANHGLPAFITDGHHGHQQQANHQRWGGIGIVNLGRADVVRHKVIDEVLELYSH